jgi:hypothetical protein
LAERGAKARVAGGRVAAPGTLRFARLGTRGSLAGTLVARLGSVNRRFHATRTHPTARGALTARVPRGTDSDGAHLTAVRLLTARVGVLTWNRRPQAMPGRGPRTCGRAHGPHPSRRLRGGHAGRAPGRQGPERLGPLTGRARPAPAGGLNRSKGQYVSLGAAVCRSPDELGSPAGPSFGRARPAPAGGPIRSKGQNVQVSLRLSVGGTQDELGPPAGPGRIPGRRFALSTRRDILAISGSN